MYNSNSDNNEYDNTLEMDLTSNVNIMGKEYRQL